MSRLALALVVLLLAACGADDESPPAADAPASTGARTVPTAPPATTGARSELRVETVATGLEVPWDLAFLPGGDALVTERPGRVRLLRGGRDLVAEPVAEIPVSAVGEGGLMGIAVDPAFEDNGFVYLFMTRSPDVELHRYAYDAATRSLQHDQLLVEDIVAGPIHDSGRIRFGPDGDLHVATGDAGEGRLAQDPESLNGKYLRLAPEQFRGDRTVRPEIVSLGHRNPQGLDWDADGRLVSTEHGPSGGDAPRGFDEINIVREGRNYGWPEVFGADHGRFTAPVRVYEEAIAPSGAAYLDAESAWQGSYVFANLVGRQLRRVRIEGDRVVEEDVLLRDRFGRLRAAVEAPDGSVYVTTSNRDGRGDPDAQDDRILRLIPPG